MGFEKSSAAYALERLYSSNVYAAVILLYAVNMVLSCIVYVPELANSHIVAICVLALCIPILASMWILRRSAFTGNINAKAYSIRAVVDLILIIALGVAACMCLACIALFAALGNEITVFDTQAETAVFILVFAIALAFVVLAVCVYVSDRRNYKTLRRIIKAGMAEGKIRLLPAVFYIVAAAGNVGAAASLAVLRQPLAAFCGVVSAVLLAFETYIILQERKIVREAVLFDRSLIAECDIPLS